MKKFGKKEKMKLKLVSVLLVCLMTSNVFASYFWLQADAVSPPYSVIDNWTEPNQWSTTEAAPTGTQEGPPPLATTQELKIMTETWMEAVGTGAYATINTNVGSYTRNLSINGSSAYPATLYINNGAVIGFNYTGGGNGLRVGSASSGGTGPIGYLYQSGGNVTTTNIYLGYFGAKFASTEGYYTISGGTLNCSTSLSVGTGRNGGNTIGKFTVDCSTGGSPIISVTALRVGGTDSTTTTNSGTLEFLIGASGVSPIGCTSVNLDAGGAYSTTTLLVTGTAPVGDILLVNNTSATAVSGYFDTVNGVVANVEGAIVDLGGGRFYALTYMYNSVNGTVGSARSSTYNDIALIRVPGITISKPPDTNTGDLLIAAVATDGDTLTSLSPPSGWIPINCGANGSAVTLAAWWKLAGASEPATHTFSWSITNPQQAYGWMMRFTGHDAVNPINGTPATADQTSSTPTSPTVSTTVANCLILRLGAFDGNDITVGNPGLSDPCHTAITMDTSGGSAGGTVSGGAGYIKQATIGSSGTSNFSLGSAKPARMLTIAIAPADVNNNDDIRP